MLHRNILPYLTELFPNVQFVVSTHSPFVLSSIPNAVVYDLQNKIHISEGMSDNTFESIVKGYFDVDLLSKELREKYDRYLALAQKKSLGLDDLDEIAQLELYLDEIPDYLATDIATEYKKHKLELHGRQFK